MKKLIFSILIISFISAARMSAIDDSVKNARTFDTRISLIYNDYETQYQPTRLLGIGLFFKNKQNSSFVEVNFSFPVGNNPKNLWGTADFVVGLYFMSLNNIFNSQINIDLFGGAGLSTLAINGQQWKSNYSNEHLGIQGTLGFDVVYKKLAFRISVNPMVYTQTYTFNTRRLYLGWNF